MSSTEEMSYGGVYDFSEQEMSPKTRTKSKSSPRSGCRISDDVQEDINNLLENVPEIAKHFTVLNKIGSGTFSSVYVAKLKDHPDITERFALKHIIPTSHPSRIESELRCLQEMGGAHNVMGVQACIRHKDHVVIVMPYFHHDKFQDYVRDVGVEEVRDYMKNLFLALKCVHDHDMIHRDVKPSNFLVNRKKRLYSLVDFGLAQKCTIKKEIRCAHVPTPSLVTNKSQSRSSQSSVNTNKRIPLSPKQIKALDNAKNIANSPRKRKLQLEPQDNESPRKRQNNKYDDKMTNVCEIVVTDCDKNKENPGDTGKHMTPPVAFKGSKKSPRRQLLMKRTGGMEGGHHTGVMVNSGGRSVYKSIAPSACQCYGQPSVCTICLSRMNQVAPRAGTPGFRSPEVLIKCPDQTTALDVWSAGVIFLSLLSGRYPFFKADDDMSALAQIISVVGSQEMKDAAKAYGKELIMSPTIPSVDFRVMCLKLRGCYNIKTKTESATNSWTNVPNSAWDLLAKTLHPNPETRITAAEALSHPFLTDS